MEIVEASGTHRDIGASIGERFADAIQQGTEGNVELRRRFMPYHSTPAGSALYERLVALHRDRYPQYMKELEGMAEGAGVPFEELFMVNMRGAYRAYVAAPGADNAGCFTCAVVTGDAALIGHNEDGRPGYRGLMYVVKAEPDGAPAFTALSYPGFLPGNAPGCNAEGICVSINNVSPTGIREGAGRHFIARSLLGATSVDEAVERATVPDRASGFNYTIGSAEERRVVGVEVSPESHDVMEVSGCHLHANHYLRLGGGQTVGASTLRRMVRGGVISTAGAPSDERAVLDLLADGEDLQYPIFRKAKLPDNVSTLATVLFDLDARSMKLYDERPAGGVMPCRQFSM